MLPVGYDLWYFPDTAEFGESVAGADLVAALPPETIVLKAVYLSDADISGPALEQARQRLATQGLQGREDVHLLRPVASTDGPPFRAALIYRTVQRDVDVRRFADPRIPHAHSPGVYPTRAICYNAIRTGTAYGWEQDYTLGRTSYFLTGTGATALWRLARLEPDALDREVLLLAPVRLPHGLAAPNFDKVADPKLRQYLREQFEAFQRAVVSAAHFEVVDRAANIAEGVLAHCLTHLGRPVPQRLADRLQEAKQVLEDKALRAGFLLSDYGYHLAHKIRLLHGQLHEDQAGTRGRTVRPEVGMAVASDLSELLVEVGLARY